MKVGSISISYFRCFPDVFNDACVLETTIDDTYCRLLLWSKVKTLRVLKVYRKRVLFLFWVVTMTVGGLDAQDPIFSQFYNAPLQLNPALAGIGHAPRFALNYRNQWPLVSDAFAAYATYSASYDQYFEDYNSGLGVQILADDAGGGLIKTNKAALFYSYNLYITNETFIKGGIEVSMLQTRVGWDKLVFGDQLDPRYGNLSPGGTPYPTEEIDPQDDQSLVFDVGFGTVLYNSNYFVGISLKHLNSPNTGILGQNEDAYDGLPTRFSLHGGYQFRLKNSDVFVTPNAMYVKQGDFSQLNAGAYVGIQAVYAGLWYRHANTNGDAVIASVGLKKGMWKFGYSYDYTVSDFGIQNGGSHEFGMIIDLGEVRKKKTVYNDCFQLFR